MSWDSAAPYERHREYQNGNVEDKVRYGVPEVQLRRVVAVFFFVGKRCPVKRRMPLAEEEVAKEECDNPTNDKADHSVNDAFEGFAFALGEDALVEEHEAELDQTQTRYLHQFD